MGPTHALQTSDPIPPRQNAPILVVIGTRPEAIKLAPVVIALRRAGLPVRTCLSGQHHELLDQGLSAFDLSIDHQFDVMVPGQHPSALVAQVVAAVTPIIVAQAPHWVVVQGDTSTAMATALAAFHCNAPVAHVEAGLRSGDRDAPWPEEMNRRLIGQLAIRHFAPTPGARLNLLAEGVDDGAIDVTGNTAIDALRIVQDRIDAEPRIAEEIRPVLDAAQGKTLVVVTIHRRENLGDALPRIAAALKALAGDGTDRLIVLPLHPNPRLSHLRDAVSAVPGIRLIAPLDYMPFVALLRRADLILTDSGGIQEEAAALGKPVLVLREKTERPELMAGGNGILVGTETETIVRTAGMLIADSAARARLARPHNAFGDGHAADRIAARLAETG